MDKWAQRGLVAILASAVIGVGVVLVGKALPTHAARQASEGQAAVTALAPVSTATSSNPTPSYRTASEPSATATCLPSSPPSLLGDLSDDQYERDYLETRDGKMLSDPTVDPAARFTGLGAELTFPDQGDSLIGITADRVSTHRDGRYCTGSEPHRGLYVTVELRLHVIQGSFLVIQITQDIGFRTSGGYFSTGDATLRSGHGGVATVDGKTVTGLQTLYPGDSMTVALTFDVKSSVGTIVLMPYAEVTGGWLVT